jgi:hypothetical protein
VEDAQVTTVVELISATDTIAFHPTPDVTGWVYNNATLKAWYKLPTADPKLSKRPNAHGAYSPGRIFTGAALPIVNGQYYGANATEALVARNRLNAMFSDGNSVTMRVTDELGATTREVWLVEVDDDFLYDFSHFPFDVALVSPDPRRYGQTISDSDGMPSAGSGLVWDLGTAGSGLFFDWGTEGTLGQVSFTNTGTTATLPRIEVAGRFLSGFRVTEIETGRELIYTRATSTSDVISLDSRTSMATNLNGGGDVTSFLSSRDWFSIPAGATRRYQINPLGAVSGSPTITLYAAPASM